MSDLIYDDAVCVRVYDVNELPRGFWGLVSTRCQVSKPQKLKALLKESTTTQHAETAWRKVKIAIF